MITDEYKAWKAETLSRQTGHMETMQTYKRVKDMSGVKDKTETERNTYEIILAPGYR